MTFRFDCNTSISIFFFTQPMKCNYIYKPIEDEKPSREKHKAVSIE